MQWHWRVVLVGWEVDVEEWLKMDAEARSVEKNWRWA